MKCISIFKCNPQIEVIDKSHCSLEDVPNFQNYSRSLEELFLDANKLTQLNENAFRLTKLRRFSFSDNAIQEIPPDIAKLVNLVDLDCSRNQISIIPEQIKFLRGLQVCDFSANRIEYLPPGLMQLKNLTCLTLNYCLIKSLPEDFGNLKNLEYLELRENELESLPSSISNLKCLKKLDIGSNAIPELPADIGRLTSLEYLLVDGNELTTLPSKIGRLENLQCLDVSEQHPGFRELPNEISGLTSLTDLHLSKNKLESIPDGIRDLVNLSILKVDENELMELNPGIGGCESLQELVLTDNHLTALPQSIGSLSELHSLNIDNNSLRELPGQIGGLRKLGIFTLRDNLLTRLPTEIGQLEMLRVLDVSGNRLEYLPASITALSLKALWLSKNQAQPLPKLQIDELPNSNIRVLTCYLLPQQSEPDDKLIPLNFNGNYDSEVIETNRQAAVSFDTAAIDDTELENDEANFVRHNTPHPHQLRAMHQKLKSNASNNHPELYGHDNASFSLVDNNQNYSHEYEPSQESQHQSGLPSAYQHMYENGLPKVASQATQSRAPVTFSGNSHADDEYRNEINNIVYRNSFENGNETNQRDTLQDLRDNSYEYRSSKAVDLEKKRQTANTTQASNNPYIMVITVRRSKSHKPGLGLSIAGGKDTPPYKDNDEGIFVSKVSSGGPAEAAGIRVGDKILAVNSNIFHEGITHQRAVDIFKKIKPDCIEFTMRVLRDPNDEISEKIDSDASKDMDLTSSSKLVTKSTTNSSNFARTYTIPVPSETSNSNSNTMNNLRLFLRDSEKTKKVPSTLPPGLSLLDGSLNKNIVYTTLVKNYKNDLGLVLENRTDEGESRSNWSNIVIADIKPNSIAARDGKLQVDDRLLSINGTDVTGIDLDRVHMILEGTERFIRIVVSRGDYDDPIGAALKRMPSRPPLGSWFSSTSNMSHRPSLIESYQRPTFGSVTSLQKQPQLVGTSLLGAKPPKPPKPVHLLPKDSESTPDSDQLEDNPIARPRNRGSFTASASEQLDAGPMVYEAEKRGEWRRARLKSIEDEVEMAKIIAEAQRKQREGKHAS